MFSCLIIEDDFAFGMNVKVQVQAMGIKVLDIVSSIDGIEEMLLKNHVDIIISDVKLEDGKYAYEFFNQKSLNIPIIFVSAYKEQEIFEKSQMAKPYIFLTKPVDPMTLKSAVDGALREKIEAKQKGGDIQRSDHSVFIRNKGKLVPIKPSELHFVRSEGNYCYLMFENKKIAIRSSLKNILEKVDTKAVIQVHRAYLVNINYVQNLNIGNNEIKVNQTLIPIGRKYKKDLINRMND